MSVLIIRIGGYLNKLVTDIAGDWLNLMAQFKKDGSKLSNRITEARLISCPIPMIIILIWPFDVFTRWASCCLFLVIAITDILDGWVAREYNMVTDLGKALDPCVDKVLVLMMLIPLWTIYPTMHYLMLITFFSELMVSFMVFRAKHNGVKVAASAFGKFRMVVQCIVIVLLLMPIWANSDWCYVAMLASTVVSLLSLISYGVIFYREYVANQIESQD
jgi:CDP-diacylglycerol--glycerol-3-phosphate 3-phosphatidyltransferase